MRSPFLLCGPTGFHGVNPVKRCFSCRGRGVMRDIISKIIGYAIIAAILLWVFRDFDPSKVSADRVLTSANLIVSLLVLARLYDRK